MHVGMLELQQIELGSAIQNQLLRKQVSLLSLKKHQLEDQLKGKQWEWGVSVYG